MKRLINAFAVLTSLIIASMAYAEPIDAAVEEPNEPANVAAVQDTYNQWIEDVTTANGNPEKVLTLYSPDAILLATLEATPLKTPEALYGYFEKFTSLNNLNAVTDKLITYAVGDFAINSGLYTFSYVNDEGETVSVPARFTFVYEKENGKWLIIKHHSSATPE